MQTQHQLGSEDDPKVLSKSQDTPHFVRSGSDGQYICDRNCPQWMFSQICSHTVTTAEINHDLMSSLEWYMYVKSSHVPKYSLIALSGFSHGRGQKGGKPKQQPDQASPIEADNKTLREG